MIPAVYERFTGAVLSSAKKAMILQGDQAPTESELKSALIDSNRFFAKVSPSLSI